MKVLITGGAGRVGTPVSQKFVRNGWDVRVIGADPDSDIAGIEYTQCDILDFDALSEQVKGCDAIVHLAAIASPVRHPAHQVFDVNVTGTHNVYSAAAKHGIKRVVQASSINALGGYWGDDDRQYAYFPIDEAHPQLTSDPYSFSKQIVEDIADYFWRRDKISGCSFRFPAVWTVDMIEERGLVETYRKKRQMLDEFINLPQVEQNKQMASARERVLIGRANRIMEYDARQSGLDKEHTFYDDLLWSLYYLDRYNYWAYIHTDDSTQAIEKAIIGDYEGSHPLFVNSDNNYLNYDSETLLRLFFPDVTERSKPIQGMDTLVSFDRARDLIGFEPTYRVPQ